MKNLERNLESSAQSVEEHQKKIQELELQGSRKGLLDERERWKRLVESLREDVASLKSQLLKKRSRSTSSVDYNTKKAENEGTDIPREANGANGVEHSGDQNGGNEGDEVSSLRIELQAKDQEIEALRKKLDFELEQKWLRKKKATNGWRQSLIESFKEVIAPLPSPTLDAISDKRQTMEGISEEEASVV